MSDTFDHALDAEGSREQESWYDNPYNYDKPAPTRSFQNKRTMQYMTDSVDWNATLPGATKKILIAI